MRPRISLICIVLNVAKYIEDTIKNIQAQTCGEWELIFVDGASTDGTQEIIKKYQKNDPRIKLLSEPDEGPWDATEKGVAMAKGEFMMIIAGQDGFADNEWFAKCLRVLDADKTVSLVWASTRDMTDDGRLINDEKHVTYSHFLGHEGRFDAARIVAGKFFEVARDIMFGSSGRRKILLKKMFSPTARLKLNFFTHRSFPGGVPQKEDWFRYWLDTGVAFSEQPMCVAIRVYLDCVAKYPRGSRIVMNHIADFHYNFNAKGYLSRYIPTLAGYGRMHPGNSGDRLAGELYRTQEEYFRKILALRKRILAGHEPMTFRDRDGKPVYTKKF